MGLKSEHWVYFQGNIKDAAASVQKHSGLLFVWKQKENQKWNWEGQKFPQSPFDKRYFVFMKLLSFFLWKRCFITEGSLTAMPKINKRQPFLGVYF